ncbi:MAG: NAD(P)H-binding protein [Pseudomonadota bacterium]
MQEQTHQKNLTLVLGGTGKTGRRIVDRLRAGGHDVRVGSRSATPSFDWDNESSWEDCLRDVTAVYLTYAPDLAMPGAVDAIRGFVDLAKRRGVRRLVLLSGRGEEEAQACERVVQGSDLEWTIVRASWFNQNFSEGAFIDMVMSGAITLPAGEQVEPFVDVDDIADVATAALIEDHHIGQVYELTGPRPMSLADVAADLSNATGREIVYLDVPHESFIEEVKKSGAPRDVVWMLDYLFSTVLDGRNSHVCDGVQRALGREPRDFSEYARRTADTGIWRLSA